MTALLGALDPRVHAPQRHPDMPLRRCVLNRVIKKIYDHLLQQGRISNDHHARRNQIFEMNRFLISQEPHLLGSRNCEFAEIHYTDFLGCFACLQSRNFE